MQKGNRVCNRLRILPIATPEFKRPFGVLRRFAFILFWFPIGVPAMTNPDAARPASEGEQEASLRPTVVLPAKGAAVQAKARELSSERWQAENKDALESSNQYVQERGLPIRHAVTPEALVEVQLLADVEAVLRDGETVQQFIEAAVREAIAMRRCLADFHARGEVAWQKYQRTGDSHSVDEVLAELCAMTELRRKQIGG